jgi:hypothetical protein
LSSGSTREAKGPAGRDPVVGHYRAAWERLSEWQGAGDYRREPSWAEIPKLTRRAREEKRARLNREKAERAIPMIETDSRMISFTPPGRDWLPHYTRPDGGLEVHDEWARYWNDTAQARAKRAHIAATKHADRVVARLGGERTWPVQFARAKALQRRGVLHWHRGFVYATPLQRAWLKAYVSWWDRQWRRELRRWTPEELRTMLMEEWAYGKVVRGFYGFGFVDRRPLYKDYTLHEQARYLGKQLGAYFGENMTERASLYVAPALVKASGASIRNLRRRNWLIVRKKLGLPLRPPHWSDDVFAGALKLLDSLELESSPAP